MKKPFTLLTKADVEYLRKKPAYGFATYRFSPVDVYNAREHLQILYPNCRVQTRFACTILLLNELY